MKLTQIDHPSRVASQPGSVVVCIVSDGPHDALAECLHSVLTHTGQEVPIVVVGGDGIHNGISGPQFEGPTDRNVCYYFAPNPRDDFAGFINVAAALSAPADAVLLTSTCLVAAGWLEGLRDAAYSDARVASSTALTTHDVAIGSYEEAAASIRATSLRLRPTVSTPGGCLFIRRSAFDLVGLASSDRNDPGFLERCVRAGLRHIFADDVLVLDRGRMGIDAGDESSPLARAINRAGRALNGLSVIIDGRILENPTTGIQVHLLEVIAALARTENVRLSLLVPRKLSDQSIQALQSLPTVALLSYDQASQPNYTKADVVHRPFQLSDPGDVTFLASLGKRLLVTQHDLIAYNNPSYFGSLEAWHGYRELTRVGLGTADRVFFPSAHGRDEALTEGLTERARTTVVPNGVQNQVVLDHNVPTRPDGMPALPAEAEMLLTLGNDYWHKNRLFALRIFERLHSRHGWQGYLAFAGPTVPHGSSKSEEAEWLKLHPTLAPYVLNLGPVSEAEKAWLLRHSRMVLYPTIYEGFGLVPFEAAEHDVPCMWAAGTSLSEVLPDSAAVIVAWNADQSAERALELMRSGGARRRNIDAIRAAGRGFTWDAAAARLLEAYEATCVAPPTLASTLARRGQVFVGTFSEDAMRLVGPGGVLPSDVERALLAVATHRGISTSAFGALKLGYRISHKVRRLRTNGVASAIPSSQRRK